MSLPLIVLGAGGHAKVLLDALLASSARIIGIVDPEPALAGATLLGVPVLGGDEIVAGHAPGAIRLVNGLGSVGYPARRQALFDRFKEQGYAFASVIHPGAIVAADTILGEGVQVMAGAVIQPGCRLGRNVIVNTRAAVDHDCGIGDHVHIAPGVTLSGGVRIGASSHVGTGATVIQGICIGERSLVGAGALLVKDVPAGVTVVGVPAKVVTR